MSREDAEVHSEKDEAAAESRGRNPQGYVVCESNGTARSGERVLESVTGFLEKRLKLKVNREKSAVDRPWKRKFLGYSLTWAREPRLKVALGSVT